METKEPKETLPFSDLKQNAFLGYLIINEQFFKMMYTRVKPTWFLAERSSQLWLALYNYYTKYQSFPTIPALKSSRQFQLMEPKERDISISWINVCTSATNQFNLEALKTEISEWMHSIILLNAMDTAGGHFNSGRTEVCYNILNNAIKEVQTSSFNRGMNVGFRDYAEYLKQTKEDRKDALTTGLDILDKAILKGAVNGGLQRGDSTVIMAPVNIGKTTTLINIAVANIRRGYNVLVMTHEGRPEDIRLKMLACILKTPIEILIDLYKNEAGIKMLEDAVNLLEKHLLYIPYNKAGMTIEEVVPIIRTAQEERKIHTGKGFDLLISDYPAKLTTELAKKGTLQRRNVDEVIYENYVQLALEYGFHSLTAIQTNRAGSTINKRANNENQVLQVESVSESFNPIMGATNVITLNRSPFAEANNIITFGVAKSRGSQGRSAVIAGSNFGCAVSHSEELGGMMYYGTKLLEERFHDLIKNYRNQVLNDQMVNSNTMVDKITG